MSPRSSAPGISLDASDPNTDATERPLQEAFDHEAEARGDHAYVEAPAGGVYLEDGTPVIFDAEGNASRSKLPDPGAPSEQPTE